MFYIKLASLTDFYGLRQEDWFIWKEPRLFHNHSTFWNKLEILKAQCERGNSLYLFFKLKDRKT